MKRATITLLLICGAVFAQQKDTFTDTRDKKTYKTVKIGTQTWMAQNLDWHGEDGHLGLCYGDEPKKRIRNPENCRKYGRLYDWDEAMQACSKGWHLPSNEEWQTLVDFAGGGDIAGKKLKTKNGWDRCKRIEIDNRGRVTNNDDCGTDDYGFSALPGGISFDNFFYVNFDGVGNYGGFWSATESVYDLAHLRGMAYRDKLVVRAAYSKSVSLSVRCLKD
jgi:uncharacterized protein (TIGR02145 family)